MGFGNMIGNMNSRSVEQVSGVLFQGVVTFSFVVAVGFFIYTLPQVWTVISG